MTKKSVKEKNPTQKSAEEVAALYKEKFESTKSMRTLHIDKISVELIEKMRKQIASSGSLLERLTDKGSRKISEENKIDAEIKRQKFDKGEFSVNEFNSIAKEVGTKVRDGFLRTLGTKFLNKITKQEI